MRHLRFSPAPRSTYAICLLVPTIRSDEIRGAYIDPFPGVDSNEVMVLDLHYSQTAKKTPMAEIKAYIEEELVPVFEDLSTRYVLVADSDYFKALTGTQKVDANLGYVLPSAFGPQQVIYVPNYRQIFYDPERITAKIQQAMTALLDHMAGAYQPPGADIVGFSAYPRTHRDIDAWLSRLLSMEGELTCDIEGFGLKHHEAGIGTISFAWSKSEGIAFPVDWVPIPGATSAPFGRQERDEALRVKLRHFFEEMKRRGRKITWHHIGYDAYVLIYQLYMRHILDTEGLLRGMDVLLWDFDCTKLISYLATNSCAGNDLSLKAQAQEFAGNYAQSEIRDIRNIQLDRLLRYNLVDCLSTWFVREKHWDTLVADQQLDIYETLFKPATRDIIQMQLTGMPINRRRTREVRWILHKDRRAALKALQSSLLVKRYIPLLKEEYAAKKNAKWKKKRITAAEVPDSEVRFNPNSDPQLRGLLYEMLALPVIDRTDSGAPSTGAKTLEKLINRIEDPEVKEFLQALIDYAAVETVLTTFIPAMLGAVEGVDGWHYLFGNFNLGGTVSGRLSSSDPNLQNIPTGAEGEKTKKGQYGKLIKSCFGAPPGYIFLGLDFASLEDRISALTTKDPNKLKVYTDGYDGHSLRAHAYFGEKMPDIDPNSVESINSIADDKRYKPFRQQSKAPTFALTYQGTWSTLVNNCGFTPELARQIEARYHELYQVSDDWVKAKLDQASKDGYVTAAFGLRVRTPLLKQVIRGNRATPHEAEAEGRTAGNALGQSWCLLNSRAASEFMTRVRSGNYKTDIRPCAQIHDAQYYLVRDDLAVVAYVNEHLVKAVQWQDHPDIWHDEVKLGGEVSLFWPDWTGEIVLPNGADETTIPEVVQQALDKRHR